MGAELILKHFPELSERQFSHFQALEALYKEWNAQINVISRKDIDELYLRHVLHSLAIAKVMPFADGSAVLDIGTGGGFPGIPLAILFPNSSFTLVDSIGKKIKVVNEVIAALELSNARALHERAENVRGQFDFVVSRAVTRLSGFIPLTRNKFKSKQINGFPNGILYLKGGDLSEELKEVKHDMEVFPISDYFDDPFFDTKHVVYVRMID